MLFAGRLRDLRAELRLSQRALAAELGCSSSSIALYELGQRDPGAEGIKHLAAFFGVSTDYLLGVSDTRLPLPTDAISVQRTVKVPVVGSIPAGPFRLTQSNVEGWEDVPEEEVRDGEYFLLQVRGDSMAPRIADGYMVLVRIQPEVSDGDLAIVQIDTGSGPETALKRVKLLDRKAVLCVDNPHYDPVIVSLRDLRIVGKVTRVHFRP